MDRLTIIVAMTGMGFTVLGAAMWRLHVLLEAAVETAAQRIRKAGGVA